MPAHHHKKKESAYQKKIAKVEREFKHHKLHSGSKHGPIVTSKAQATAIVLAIARKHGKTHKH